MRRLGRVRLCQRDGHAGRLAEHLKRIRNDYCEGSLRDTLNRFLPQPAGPRRAIIRVPEPLGLHAFTGSADEALTSLLRARMQAALDAINAGLAADGARRYPNPFHRPKAAV